MAIAELAPIGFVMVRIAPMRLAAIRFVAVLPVAISAIVE